jgi:putative DNA methylase
MQARKLIEAAMPIKEISVESVRDKSIRHGHISTLHLWWARRPLPVCRAVVFASLIPDPLDEGCPQAFKDAVKLLLGKQENNTDPYKPYDDIPYTSAIDKMEDNLRNRLMMFIGKYSDKYIQNEKQGKSTNSKEQLSDASLIKWDNKNNENIIGKARKLIWVAHNAASGKPTKELLSDFDKHYKAILDAEQDLYSTLNRHIEAHDIKVKNGKLHKAIEEFQDKMPKVFDPFAGGGAIPLEAARLGCRSYGNDINPVAHIIQKGSLEFPQKFGKPISFSKMEFLTLYGKHELMKWCKENGKHADADGLKIEILNRLAFDVEFYAKKLLAETENKIGHLYPADAKGNKPIAYYWARVGTCSNPSCKAQVPLLKQFYLSKRRGSSSRDWIYLNPIIKGTEISFEISKGNTDLEGWNNRGNLKCPCCGNTTDIKTLKKQCKENNLQPKLLAVIYEAKQGKSFSLPTKTDTNIFKTISTPIRPNETMQRNSAGGDTFSWNITKWGQLFSDRQVYCLNGLIESLHKLKNETSHFEKNYSDAIITYLSILIDRICSRNTMFGRWHIHQDTIEHPFGRQAIQMIFDYPEMNPFTNFSGSATGQLKFILGVIEEQGLDKFSSILNNSSSGEKTQFEEKYLTAVVTDPPYYDAIAYADISDFFYVWLKKMLADIYPLIFSTPQTPKTDECTALKHHHEDDYEKAKKHFEDKLLQILDAIEHQTSDIVSIMFAHQSTEAWTTLCNSILGAQMNITGSWAIDTEMAGRMVAIGNSALSSSVTVSCKPSQKGGYGDYKEVKRAIEKTVSKEVDELYRLGFRGADLLTACFGQAVSEFGKYEKVEKADGSNVTVAELLEMARESAFNALLKGFEGDEFTKFYIGWLQLYGFVESEFDDAAKFSRVGLSINVQELFTERILIKNGNKQTLGGFQERLNEQRSLGDKPDSFLIDQVHRAMSLFKGTNRKSLLEYIDKVASNSESSFWRVVTSLCEVLPVGSEDHKQAIGLLTNKDSLIRESKTVSIPASEQTKLFE